jgi:hypothetical protein
MYKDKLMFMEGDAGGGFGGDGGSDAGGDTGGGQDVSTRGTAVFEGESGEPHAPEPQRQPQQVAPAAPQVNARELAAEFGQVIGQHFQPPPKEISQAEAKRLLNIWEPTKEWLAKYDNIETRDQAIAEQRDGLIKQADTLMRYRMGEMQRAMEERFSPALQHMQAEQARAGEWRFSQAFPQLNKVELRPLLFSVAQSILASGARFSGEAELFTAIARGVESVIKVSNPQFSLEANGNGGRGVAVPQVGKRTGPTAGSIPVTTPGAGGSGGTKGTGPPKPRGLAIFDP